MNQRTLLVMHGIVLSSMTSACKMMSHSHSQIDRVSKEGWAALKKVTIYLNCLFQYFLMWKQKHIRTNFLAFCQSASLLLHGASCGSSPESNDTVQPVLSRALTSILMCSPFENVAWSGTSFSICCIIFWSPVPVVYGWIIKSTKNSVYYNIFSQRFFPGIMLIDVFD